MGIRRRTRGRSLALVAGAAFGVGLAVAEPAPDEKPHLDLPEVVVEGVDQSHRAVRDLPTIGDPKTGALPMPDPPLADPRDVVIDDGAGRTTFDAATIPDRPTPLTVRGLLSGGSFTTLRAGFDAMRQIGTGGVFGELGGVASGGHIDDAGWTRAHARLGGVGRPAFGGVVRGQLSYRAREQDLPVAGRLSTDLGPEGRTQTFRRWGLSGRALYDESVDLDAEVSLDVSRSDFRAQTGARSQQFLDATITAHVEVPLPGRLWRVSTTVAGGGRSEEGVDGRELDRTRLRIRAVGRVGDDDGIGLEAGFGFLRFDDDDVFAPDITLFYQRPPTQRLWVGVEPFLDEPDLLGFLDETSYAFGTIGQPAEVADFRLHGGGEWKPDPLITVSVESGLRRSTGFAHADVVPTTPGLYRLATLDQRYVVDVGGRGSVELIPGTTAELTFRAEFVEGTQVPYTSEHRTGLGVRVRGTVDARSTIEYAAAMRGGAAEGSPTLDGAWLWSAGVGFELLPRTWLTVDGDNLLDQEHVTLAEIAAVGRRVDAGVRYAF